MKISVIIIGYNVEKYIFRCINSIVNQSYSNLEIIYVDDGSTDDSVNIVKNLSSKDNRIVVIEDKNNGPYIARMHGLEQSTGEYFIFVDGDDWIDINTIQMLKAQIDKNHLDVILFDYLREDLINKKEIHNRLSIPNNTIINRKGIVKNILPNLMFNSCFCSPCNKIYRTEYVKNIVSRKNVSIKYGEDMIFLLDIFDNLKETIYLDQELYHYCINNNNSLSQIHYMDSFNTVVRPLFNVRYDYALRWNCLEDLYVNTCYLGICELIFNLKQKDKRLFILLKNDLFLKSIRETNIKTFYKKFNSKKLFFLIGVLKIIAKIKRKGGTF